MKIAICGLINNENLGEQFISKSLIWIIKQTMEQYKENDIEFVEVDIEAKNDYLFNGGEKKEGFIYKRTKKLEGYKKRGLPIDLFMIATKRLIRKIHFQKLKNLLSIIRHWVWENSYNYKRRHEKYFQSRFAGVSMIVIDGAGLLEYSSNEYEEPLLLISEYAKQNHIPVIYNAIGLAGEFNTQDYRCKIFMRALSMECVKYVSARDSVECVQKCVRQGMKVELLADAAFCLNEAFNIAHLGKTGVIGIGLVRGNALQSYGVNFTEDNWINLFCDIADELFKRGYNFQFFTNGMSEDYLLGEKIIKKKGLDFSYLVKRPTCPEELLNTINNYDGLITCRMHSSIAAFTLGIPSVILSWNDKVKKYMDMVGYPDRAITVDCFDARFIVDSLERTLNEGIDEENIRRMNSLAKKGPKEYLKLLVCE